MKRFAVTVAALLAAGAVNAQIYQWKDASGKTVISDKPPTGNVRQARKIEAEEPVASSAPAKTTADREMDYRKRQQEAQEKSDKAQKEEKAAADKKENCERARRYLQTLESGERIGLRDNNGERYYMEDAQREQETAKARQTVQSACK